MELEYTNGLVVMRLPKYVLVLTREEWERAVRRGKSIKRREEEEKREKDCYGLPKPGGGK